MDVLRRSADDLGLALPEAARRLPEALSPRARISIEKFFALLQDAAAKREELSAGDHVGWLLEASGLFAQYDGEAEEKVARRENLQQLAAAVAEASTRGQDLEEFQSRCINRRKTVRAIDASRGFHQPFTRDHGRR